MKKFINNLLSPDEQKVLGFLIALAIVGMLIHFSGVLSGISNSEESNEIVYDENYEIKLNLETVTFEDLVMIPGIGEKKAEDILTFREKHGFKSKTDLMKIKGIGQKTYDKIEEYFYLEGDSTSSIYQPEVGSKSSIPELIKVNINTATLDELTQLKGIGKKRAAQIIELREKIGGFTQKEQLLEIKGIGEVTLAKIQTQIILNPAENDSLFDNLKDNTGGTND